jgi:hypothetical protein
MSVWPDFFFQPVNLWNYPKQYRDYQMINEETTVHPQWVLKDLKADDTQVDGTHYKDMPIEPWDAMEVLLTPEEFIGFLKGNYLKYVMRADKKIGALHDTKKAKHYKAKLKEVKTQ